MLAVTLITQHCRLSPLNDDNGAGNNQLGQARSRIDAVVVLKLEDSPSIEAGIPCYVSSIAAGYPPGINIRPVIELPGLQN